MLNRVAKFVLTATALAPIAITYAWVALIDDNKTLAVAFLGLAALLVALCVAMLRLIRNEMQPQNFKVNSAEAADRENIAFLLLYIAPLFTSQFEDLNWTVIVPVLVVFGFVVSTGFYYHFNPLLGVLGWHFYRVGTPEGITYVLITRRELRSVRDSFQVVQVTEYIVLDVGD